MAVMFGERDENGIRDFAGRGNQRQEAVWVTADNMPRVQRASKEKNGPLPERDIQVGWCGLVLLALFVFGGRVL